MWDHGYQAFRLDGDGCEPIRMPLGIFQYNAFFTKRKDVSLGVF